MRKFPILLTVPGDSRVFYKGGLGFAVAVSGHMKVVLLNPYRGEILGMLNSLALLIFYMFLQAFGECITGKSSSM